MRVAKKQIAHKVGVDRDSALCVLSYPESRKKMTSGEIFWHFKY